MAYTFVIDIVYLNWTSNFKHYESNKDEISIFGL